MVMVVDENARQAWESALEQGCLVIGRRETARSGQPKDDELQSRNDVLLRLNCFWTFLQPTSETEALTSSADEELRRLIRLTAQRLFDDLTETAPLDWWTIRAVFKGQLNSPALSQFLPQSGLVEVASDMEARRAAVRLCEVLFGAAQGGASFDALPNASSCHQKLIKVLGAWLEAPFGDSAQ